MRNVFVLGLLVVVLLCLVGEGESLCHYCAYAPLCDRCEGCPCDPDEEPTCDFCKYCTFCSITYLCDTVCAEGTYTKAISDYFGRSAYELVAATGIDLAGWDLDEIASDVKNLPAAICKDDVYEDSLLNAKKISNNMQRIKNLKSNEQILNEAKEARRAFQKQQKAEKKKKRREEERKKRMEEEKTEL